MIRPAEVADLPRLHECAREFYQTSGFLGSFDLDRFCGVWTRLLGNGTGTIFVDERGAEIAGTIGALVHEDLYEDRLIAAELFWFARKEYRGAGLRLYRQFEGWAKEKGAAVIQMGHLLDSMPEKVSRFYQREGYTATETLYRKSVK